MNKAKIKLFSETKNSLTDKQIHLIEEILMEASVIKTKFVKTFNFSKNESFLIPLINREAIYSGYIENSETNIEDIDYDIEEGINNVYSWESRNVINLYKKLFYQIDKNLFFFTKQTLITMHTELFISEYKDKYKLIYNPSLKIKKIKPGVIITSHNKQNWIGQKTKDYKKDLANASLIPIAPEFKEKYINDLFDTLFKKINDKSLTVKDIISFHPHFEAIHPFADGNGRIGRLLLVAALVIKGFPKWLALNISKIISENKIKYFEALKSYATDEDKFKWNSFFIEVLIEAKHKMEKQTDKFSKIFNYYNDKYANKKVHFEIFNYFLKFYKVHKKIVINNLIQKNYQTSTIYRAFNEVVKDLDALEENKYYIFTKGTKIWE